MERGGGGRGCGGVKGLKGWWREKRREVWGDGYGLIHPRTKD